jgi:putative transposase
MPDYRRAFQPGGSFFFTLVTEGREPIFEHEWCRQILRESIARCRATRPFVLDAIVLLLDHLHLMLTLPIGDADFSTRIAAIKAVFTREYLARGGIERFPSVSRRRHRNRGVWQKRFWEHLLRDENDFSHHLDYLHFNPVKHGLVECPHKWPYSTFERWTKREVYAPSWLCTCEGRTPTIPIFDDLAGVEMDL